MSEKDTWFGYLEAGAKSSPVLIDPGLSTGNTKTVYVFNLARRAILEYAREILDAKLRPLQATERSVVGELQAAYAQARVGFTPRGGRSVGVPERGPAARRRREEAVTDADDYEQDSEEIDGLDWSSSEDD